MPDVGARQGRGGGFGRRYDIVVMYCKSRLKNRAFRDVRGVQDSSDGRPTWVFLTNHAHVLLSVARDPEARARDIAEQVGITERAAQRIVSDLVAGGYLAKTKLGRRNRYTVNRKGHLRHATFQELEIGPLLDVLQQDGDGAGKSRSRTR
jgi:DNA-binding MarR family transcriptional regulator